MKHILIGLILLTAGLGSIPSSTASGPAPVFHEDWEHGTAGWNCRFGPGPVIVNDAAGPDGTHVQSYDHAGNAADCVGPEFTVPGGTYCISSWIKWDSGGWPFLGLMGTPDWRIGSPGYSAFITPVPDTATGWHGYSNQVDLAAGSYQVRTELFDGQGKGGPNVGYFDGILIGSGPCPGNPPFPLPELSTLVLGSVGLVGIAGVVIVARRKSG